MAEAYTLIAWCAGCDWYLPLEEAGTRCPSDHCERTLRKRRAYICRDCEEHPQFFNRAAYDRHTEEHRRLEEQWAERNSVDEWMDMKKGMHA